MDHPKYQDLSFTTQIISLVVNSSKLENVNQLPWTKRSTIYKVWSRKIFSITFDCNKHYLTYSRITNQYTNNYYFTKSWACRQLQVSFTQWNTLDYSNPLHLQLQYQTLYILSKNIFEWKLTHLIPSRMCLSSPLLLRNCRHAKITYGLYGNVSPILTSFWHIQNCSWSLNEKGTAHGSTRRSSKIQKCKKCHYL